MEPPEALSGRPQPSNSAGKRAAHWLRPYARQAWFNLRVWLPFLINPPDRARLVRFWGRESRHRGVWQIALPRQCWKCGTESSLENVRCDTEVRSFDSPMQLIGIPLSTGALLLLVALWLHSLMLTFLALFTLAAMPVLLVMKSWTEEVQISIWSCAAHADDLQNPDVVADQEELFVFLPTASLAEATREELKARRRGEAAARAGDRDEHSHHAPPSPIPMADDSQDEQPKYYRPPAIDLPPIKLADDDPGEER